MKEKLETFVGNLDPEETKEVAKACLTYLQDDAAFQLVMLYLKDHNLLGEAEDWINSPGRQL